MKKSLYSYLWVIVGFSLAMVLLNINIGVYNHWGNAVIDKFEKSSTGQTILADRTTIQETTQEGYLRSSETKSYMKCPSLTHQKAGRERQKWQAVIQGSDKMYVFSAFLDDVDKATVIRVIGVTVPSFHTDVYCQLWYDSGKHHVVKSGQERWSLQNYKRKYIALYIVCPLPDTEIPHTVTLTVTECGQSNCTLHIMQKTKTKRNFTVCLPPFNFQYGRAYELVEMIEGSRLFGAEYFVFYNYSANINIFQVLKQYVDEGLAEIVQWPLPMKVDSYPARTVPEITYFGQLAAINDCLFRNLYSSSYVVVSDLDELIVPRKHDRWIKMLNSIPAADAYVFQNVFFRLEWPDIEWTFPHKEEAIKYNITFVLKQRRETNIWRHFTRSKYIFRPRSIKIAGTHEIIKFRGLKNYRLVGKEIALLHHYRNWEKYTDGVKRVDDTSIAKFQKELITNIVSRWSMLPNVSTYVPRAWE